MLGTHTHTHTGSWPGNAHIFIKAAVGGEVCEQENSQDWLRCSEPRRNPVSSEQGNSSEGHKETGFQISLFLKGFAEGRKSTFEFEKKQIKAKREESWCFTSFRHHLP